ncbi:MULTISPECIES: LPXTG cell wall anchor domain-containing protein [unclassified Streptococcus]|uniref:LPXTG cell wall anchor domain-containing protein n=1 Tax=unclassified Streptococcus TaxID=2608887 RepID=UPI0010721660|nr:MULTISPECIES: LPXTG cell wall anchor domain-containing protein [unclassified Streptococcus]MBF0806519.1 LPXTG cell wall anchor domain-containing protein [Streptococcus sp. 19428wA2_WM07]TFU27838.1 LPXTG cell wall anchor domain-containing protein [Streptococcus sp. WM07]
MEKKAVYKYMLRASLLLAPFVLSTTLAQEHVSADGLTPTTETLQTDTNQPNSNRSDLSETPTESIEAPIADQPLEAVAIDSNTSTTSLEQARESEKGQTLTVAGKVISKVNAWGGNGFYIQDTAGDGLYVYPGKKQDVTMGDTVQLEGTLGDFNGELQLTKVANLTKVADIPVPEPTVTTVEGLTDKLQSTLVTLKNVTVGSISSDKNGTSTFNISDLNGQTVAVRVDSRTGITNAILTNLISENDTINITAILSTYRGKNQLKPFLENQFEVVKKGTALPPTEKSISIGEIQGESHTSPLENQTVTVKDVVVTYVANKNHFYVQDIVPDGNPKTSDGINVFLTNHQVAVGDRVTVTGKVVEYLGAGYSEKAQTDLTTTQIAATSVVKEGTATVPAPILLGIDRIAPTKIIEDDAFSSFDPDTDGLDFWESLEGMLVGIDNAKVLGPQSNKEIYVVPGNYTGPMNKVGGLTLEADNTHPEKIAVLFDKNLVTKTGDSFQGRIYGPISYGYTNYKLLATVANSPAVTDGGIKPEVTTIIKDPNKLTIASYNIENFSANNKTTNNAKVKRIAKSFVHDLNSPDIITLIEVQDNNGTTDDGTVDASQSARRLIEAIKAEGGPTYQYIDIEPENNMDGGAPGSNIRTGFLYNSERVSLSDKPKGDATTPAAWENGELKHSIARIDPTNAAWKNSRKPIIAEFQFNDQKINVVAVHLNSKRGDNGLFGKVQPVSFKSETQRHQMANIIHQFISEGMKQNADLNVAMLGDYNDYEFTKTLDIISGDIMSNLVSRHDLADRFSYFYQGNNQSLDNIVISNNLLDRYEFDMVHVNSIFMTNHGRASDHDPLLLQLDLRKKQHGDGIKTELKPEFDLEKLKLHKHGDGIKTELKPEFDLEKLKLHKHGDGIKTELKPEFDLEKLKLHKHGDGIKTELKPEFDLEKLKLHKHGDGIKTELKPEFDLEKLKLHKHGDGIKTELKPEFDLEKLKLHKHGDGIKTELKPEFDLEKLKLHKHGDGIKTELKPEFDLEKLKLHKHGDGIKTELKPEFDLEKLKLHKHGDGIKTELKPEFDLEKLKLHKHGDGIKTELKPEFDLEKLKLHKHGDGIKTELKPEFDLEKLKLHKHGDGIKTELKPEFDLEKLKLQQHGDGIKTELKPEFDLEKLKLQQHGESIKTELKPEFDLEKLKLHKHGEGVKTELKPEFDLEKLKLHKHGEGIKTELKPEFDLEKLKEKQHGDGTTAENKPVLDPEKLKEKQHGDGTTAENKPALDPEKLKEKQHGDGTKTENKPVLDLEKLKEKQEEVKKPSEKITPLSHQSNRNTTALASQSKKNESFQPNRLPNTSAQESAALTAMGFGLLVTLGAVKTKRRKS